MAPIDQYVPDTVLGTGDTRMSKINMFLMENVNSNFLIFVTMIR